MQFPDDPTRLPHLLEQEVQSLAHIIVFSMRLFAEGVAQEDAVPSACRAMRRCVTAAVTHYVEWLNNEKPRAMMVVVYNRA